MNSLTSGYQHDLAAEIGNVLFRVEADAAQVIGRVGGGTGDADVAARCRQDVTNGSHLGCLRFIILSVVADSDYLGSEVGGGLLRMVVVMVDTTSRS